MAQQGTGYLRCLVKASQEENISIETAKVGRSCFCSDYGEMSAPGDLRWPKGRTQLQIRGEAKSEPWLLTIHITILFLCFIIKVFTAWVRCSFSFWHAEQRRRHGAVINLNLYINTFWKCILWVYSFSLIRKMNPIQGSRMDGWNLDICLIILFALLLGYSITTKLQQLLGQHRRNVTIQPSVSPSILKPWIVHLLVKWAKHYTVDPLTRCLEVMIISAPLYFFIFIFKLKVFTVLVNKSS